MRPRLLVVGPRRGWLVALAVCLAELAGTLGQRDHWIGVWSETWSYQGSALLLAVPAGAASGGWVAVGNRRGHLDGLEAAAGRMACGVRTRTFVEVWLWASIGYLCGCVPGMALTTAKASYGSPELLPLLPGIAFLGAAAALGLLIGRAAPWTVGPPLVGVVSYVALGAATIGLEGISSAVTPIDERSMTFYRWPSWVLGAQCAVWIGVAGSLVARGARRPRWAFGIAWAAGVVAAPLLVVGPGDRVVAEAAAEPRCQVHPAQVEVCMPAAKYYLAPEVASAVEDVVDEVGGLVEKPLRIVDDEGRGVSERSNRALDVKLRRNVAGERIPLSSFSDLSAYAVVDRAALVGGLVALLVPDSLTSLGAGPDGRLLARPSDVVSRWLLGDLGLAIDGSAYPGAPDVSDGSVVLEGESRAALRWLSGLDDVDRHRWFARHRESVRTGRLTWSSFRG